MNVPAFPSRRALAGVLLLVARVGFAEELSFSRDVLPVLSEHCFQCHGPDEKDARRVEQTGRSQRVSRLGRRVFPSKTWLPEAR